MKILILLMLSFMGIQAQLYATTAGMVTSDTSTIEVVQEKSTFHIKYLTGNPSRRDIIVSIYNDQNKLCFSESIKINGSISKPYNLSELPNGIYIIKITDEQQVIVHPFQYKAITGNEPESKTEEIKKEVLIRVRKVEENENKFKVTVYSSAEHELLLRIFDKNKKVLFEGDAEQNTSRLFDLSKTRSSEFYFQVLDKDGKLIEEVVQ